MKEGIYTIDHLIVTHEDSDHSGNVESLQKEFNVKDVITEGKDFDWHGLYFDHLYLGKYDNDNDNSLVYYLNVDNRGFLFTGDISRKIDDVLVREYGDLDIDFLKVAHHGSVTGTSENLISHYLPHYAIISTNGLYDHPHESVLSTLKKYLVRYYVTKYSSTVSIYFSAGYDLLKTAKGEFVIIK
jgi:competence protein ComEC